MRESAPIILDFIVTYVQLM